MATDSPSTPQASTLGGPDGYGTWQVPSGFKIEPGCLTWQQPGGRLVTSSTMMLDEFVLLTDADDRDILRFARRWGVLAICAQHGLPSSHLPRRYIEWLNGEGALCRPAGGIASPFYEPLSAWRYYAAVAVSVLDISARLGAATPRPGPEKLWEPLIDFLPGGIVPGVVGGRLAVERARRLAPVNEQRSLLAEVVQRWLTLGDVQVQYAWRGDRPHFDLGGGNLFGALGTQLALAVARKDGLAICDECGCFFVPKRAARPGAPRRCPNCRDRAAKRESARRRRARERGDSS